MVLPARAALLFAVAHLACSTNGNGSGNKISGLTGDGAAPLPGQEAGPPGTRGGGGGAFGGGDDGDGAAPAPDSGDEPADAPTNRPDGAPDLSPHPDVHLTPVDAVTPVADSAPSSDDATDLCAGTCQTLESDYSSALLKARACNVNIKLQCQMKVTSGLKCPGCVTFVNTTTELDDIRAKWMDAGCASCRRLCPAIACSPPTSGVCRPNMGALDKGTCMDQKGPF